jgi:diacylglycerol kinase (ATP)
LLNREATQASLVARWEAQGLLAGIEVVIPRGPDEMAAQARQAADEGHHRVLVAGGDGAVHHALQGIAGTGCALGIVPLGSGNDLARALGLPGDPWRAARLALEGPPRSVDLGRVGSRWFAGIAGIGLDAEVNRYVRQHRGSSLGRWIYPWATLRALAAFQPQHIHVEHDNGVWQGRAIQALVANTPFFGGGMRIAPDARLDDGFLDLLLIAAIPRIKLPFLLPRVYRGTHVRHPAVTSLRVRRARLGAEGEPLLHADGEPVTSVPSGGVTVEIAPQSLLVIADAPRQP